MRENRRYGTRESSSPGSTTAVKGRSAWGGWVVLRARRKPDQGTETRTSLAFNFDFVNSLLQPRAQCGVFAGTDIELPAMPGAGDERPLPAAPQRAAPLMRANAINCCDLTINAKKGVDPSVVLDFPGTAWRQLAQLGRLTSSGIPNRLQNLPNAPRLDRST